MKWKIIKSFFIKSIESFQAYKYNSIGGKHGKFNAFAYTTFHHDAKVVQWAWRMFLNKKNLNFLFDNNSCKKCQLPRNQMQNNKKLEFRAKENISDCFYWLETNFPLGCDFFAAKKIKFKWLFRPGWWTWAWTNVLWVVCGTEYRNWKSVRPNFRRFVSNFHVGSLLLVEHW